MTTRYRVEYALKSHRRDQFIEWIKGLLAVPFVLYSQPTGILDTGAVSMDKMSEEAHRRYAEIMRDIEGMLDDHISHQNQPTPSKLRLLVPPIGNFFTSLPLEAAFKYQDSKRLISSRRFVSPSFNDVRLILNTAQLMAVCSSSSPSQSPLSSRPPNLRISPHISRLMATQSQKSNQQSNLRLATFDGDVTLYEDGESLLPSNPVIPRMLALLRSDIRIGIVTAAGYTTADRYHARLHGLLDAIASSSDLTPRQKRGLVIMGGEANYLFSFDPENHPKKDYHLRAVPREEWLTPEMRTWEEGRIGKVLDVAEAALQDCVRSLKLPATLMRKDRAVGIIPNPDESGSMQQIPRESLEETVLVVQKILEISGAAAASEDGHDAPIPFCAFNGGRDVFVDIGDKSWGVAVCQQWFGRGGGEWETEDEEAEKEGKGEGEGTEGMIRGDQTLHVGDQFLSAGSNDFKARSVGTTAWIANPAETVELLDELAEFMEGNKGEE